jgi:hypothetical protein
VVLVWLLVAMVVAVRQALDDRSTGRAVAVVIIGWIINVAMAAFALGLAGVAGWMATGAGS